MILSYLHSPYLLHSESLRSGWQRAFRGYDRRDQDVPRMFLNVSKGLTWYPNQWYQDLNDENFQVRAR